MKLRRLSFSLPAIILGLFPLAAGASTLAYYSFDNDFTDGSGNGNDLSASSGTPNITSTAGEFVFGGGALDLDQSGTQEHLIFSAAQSFDGSSAWSMSWWGKRSTSAAGSHGMIAGTIANSNNFVWTPDNPNVVRGLRVRRTTSDQVDYGGIVDDNAFHHWAVSYDGAGNITAWRDNSSLGSLTFSGTLDLTHFGAGTANQANSFWGQIDELYIFDEALDAAAVNNLFTNVPEPSSLGLVGLSCLMLLRRRR